ncbi:hypothetical protein QBC46DRAFT_292734 [Diplogelasinospora grovesii]|uniref:Apple domain-containing protein n=1 Tax=Diplogelasinospora grovesii TaxID=303347 RepID=A0AAN6N4C6_9PEZI|nr:hypothetical protein QBC46DRAFT_292734 [Diplogelasinospora grovesii]
MKSFTAIVALAAFFSAAAANPLAPRAQMCNQTPTASNANANNNNVQSIATPTCSTAEACQQQCTANSQCQSFVFGLPPTGSTPTCMLFAVPASEVPNQGTDLNVFDKACTSVPTGAPTHSKPQGQ